MDELELLKKDWRKQNTVYKQLSAKEIYPILQKKSSSIAKTLFYISVGELVFWILINSIPYFSSDSYRERLNAVYSNEYVFVGLTFISYGVIILFIYLLFKSHKAISATDNAKKLMESILKTRRVIKYYVIYNLVMVSISMLVGTYFAIVNDPKLADSISHFNNNQIFMAYAIIIGATAFLILIIWLFYKLLYGLLLKRLNRNYQELKNLEF